jgi:hypothetical protein
MQLLPPSSDKCPICAADAHSSDISHNRDSWFYIMQFMLENNRPPTWDDASSDCPTECRAAIYQILIANDVPKDNIGNFDDVLK